MGLKVSHYYPNDYVTNLKGKQHLYHVRVPRYSGQSEDVGKSEEDKVAKHDAKCNQVTFAVGIQMLLK